MIIILIIVVVVVVVVIIIIIIIIITTILSWMSLIALPAVILGEGKSLISKLGQDELVSVASSLPRRRKISDSKTRADRAL